MTSRWPGVEPEVDGPYTRPSAALQFIWRPRLYLTVFAIALAVGFAGKRAGLF